MDEVDFTGVYQEYFKPVYAYVYSLCQDHNVAEEVTQETFYKALRGIDRFDGRCQLRVWLCQIAKNTYFTHCRKQRTISWNEQEEMAGRSDFTVDIENREIAKEVEQHLQGLEEPYFSVFFQRIYRELSFGRIAEMFGKSESWARVTFYRAKQKIMERMGQKK